MASLKTCGFRIASTKATQKITGMQMVAVSETARAQNAPSRASLPEKMDAVISNIASAAGERRSTVSARALLPEPQADALCLLVSRPARLRRFSSIGSRGPRWRYSKSPRPFFPRRTRGFARSGRGAVSRLPTNLHRL